MMSMNDPFALVRLPAQHTRFVAKPEAIQRVALCGLGATVLLAMAFLTAGLPVLSMCMLAFAGVSSFVFGSATELSGDAPRHAVAPEDIVSIEVRAQYQAILLDFAEIERTLARAPRLIGSLASVIERCRAAVALSGQIALLANPIQHYLDGHDPAHVRAALDRLRARVAVTSDDVAVGTLQHAAAARVRQLMILRQLAASRDRVAARLELVHAALEGFAATIVKLQALEEEQLVLAGDPVTDQIEVINSDLEALESALESELGV